MPVPVAPPSTPASVRYSSITAAEVRTALTWALGYEAAVLAVGGGLRWLLISLRAGLLLTVFDWLLNALLLPASLVALVATSALDGWRSLVGLLGLNIAAAFGVALFLVHRRARAAAG
jgi:hypothetical protein